MAKTNSSFYLVAFFFGVTFLCNGPSVDATRMIAHRFHVALPRWCVAKQGLSDETLQGAIDYFCNKPEVDCNIIKPGGPCFNPDTKFDHASFAINMYMNANGVCPSDVGLITFIDPSHGSCTYASWPKN